MNSATRFSPSRTSTSTTPTRGFRRRRALGASAAALLLPVVMAATPAAAAAPGVEFLEMHQDGVAGADGLGGGEGIAISPDERFVYVAAAVEDAIGIYRRDTSTGALTYVAKIEDGVGGADGLNDVRGIAISADGAFLYASAATDASIAVFARDDDSGLLTFIEAQKDGSGGISSLGGAFCTVLSPGDAHLYVSAKADNAISVFRRDAATGRLTFVEEKRDGSGGMTSLGGVEALIISPDGAHVYAGATDDDTITVFSRDEDTGALTMVEVKKDGVGGIDGLDRVQGLGLSPDGASLYAASSNDNALAVFSRDAATGALTPVEILRDGVGGVDGLAGAEWVTVSANGAYVYTVADLDNALAVFTRDEETGRLGFVEIERDGVAGVDGLGGAEAVIADAATRVIYVVSDDDDAIAVFASLCGNGRLDGGEGCEDGNTSGGDCCTATCAAVAAGTTCASDGNGCTDDQCNGAGACVYVNNTRPCDDGAFCTVGDTCQGGVCLGSARDCAGAGDQCNAGVCNEAADRCQAAALSNGTTCADDNLCTQTDTCQAGVCVGANPAICTALDQCHVAGVCDPATGACSHPAQADDTACDDDDECTQEDACRAGVCVGTDPVHCVAQDQCHVAGICAPATGACSNPAKADGAACDDGDACTRADTCAAGACVGADPVICAALDQCHVAGVCDPASGACSNPLKADGAACNDGDACTRVDTCLAGACAGADPVLCTALDQCHDAGICNPATGLCSNPAKSDGEMLTFGVDADAYTDGDNPTANNGSAGDLMVDASPERRAYLRFNVSGLAGRAIEAAIVRIVTTSETKAASDDGGAIYLVDDTTWDELAITHQNRPAIADKALAGAGVVGAGQTVYLDVTDALSGEGIYSFAIESTSSNGAIYHSGEAGSGAPTLLVFVAAACDDANACTRSDVCIAGTCVGTDTVMCPAVDQCHAAGVCDPESGECSSPVKPNGTACVDGDLCTQTDTCIAGECIGANPVVCGAIDQCHTAGTCDVATGVCSTPARPDGAACDDASACTRIDACRSGVCIGADPIVCTPLDQCHVAGICDPASGTCSNPTQSNGTPCNDSTACTRADACQGGVCVGGNPVICTARDQCHRAGACDPASGECTQPQAANGSACDDGSACTRTDACQAGTCVGADAVLCRALDQCHSAGACDPASGDCSNPVKSDGARCDDGNACSQLDTCEAGVCTGNDPVVCTASDPCHAAGVCDPATGGCSNPAKADGASCDDADACTGDDVCTGGTCLGTQIPDTDVDGFCDAIDVCPELWNPDQWDMNHDGIGDTCQCTMAPPGRCIAGGGSVRTDCLIEVVSPGFPTYNKRRTRVKGLLRCTDGDPICDTDGARDGKCTFTIGLCFGNSDPRYLRCAPRAVQAVELMSPLAASAASVLDRANAANFEAMVGEMGLGVRRGASTISEAVAPMGDSLCSPGINLVVPAPEDIGGKPVRRTFRMRAFSTNGRRDNDRFALACHS